MRTRYFASLITFRTSIRSLFPERTLKTALCRSDHESNSAAALGREIQDRGEDVQRSQPGPFGALLADEVVRDADVRECRVLLLEVPLAKNAEQVRLRAQPDQLPLDLPAVRAGSPEERRDARVPGQIGELLLQDLGGDLRQEEQVGVIRTQDQVGDQLRVQDPEEMPDTVCRQCIRRKRGSRFDDEREGRAEEVLVIPLQTAPETDPAVEIFREINKDRGQPS